MATTTQQQHFDRASAGADNRMGTPQAGEVFFLGSTIPLRGTCAVLVEPTTLGALIRANGERVTVHRETLGANSVRIACQSALEI